MTPYSVNQMTRFSAEQGCSAFRRQRKRLHFGEDGNDSLNGDDGDDSLRGEAGDDSIVGHAGMTRQGGAGLDTIIGGAGNDLLEGDFELGIVAENDDVVRGNGGNDTLVSGRD